MMREYYLKMALLFIGATFFTVGAVIAYRDATLDYNMSPWGGIAAFAAGCGVGMMWSAKSV